MKTNTKWRTGLQVFLAIGLCGSAFQVGGCLAALGRSFNPCGTVLNCDPAEFDLITSDPLEPDYDFNPTCVIPGLFNCETPITVGTTPTGQTGTGTTTLGTTTTTTTGTTGRGGTTTSDRGGANFGF